MKGLLIFLIVTPAFLGAQTLLILQDAAWDYFDQGNVGNVPWTDLGFNASNWSTGNAELGYGEGDENTIVSYGLSSSNQLIHASTTVRNQLV